MSKVIVIVGPTASGKTSLSIKLAQKFNGEIINGDSIAVYKELNIGSAKVTKEEMDGVKHHLLDYVEPTEGYDVARFQHDAREAIEEINSQGKVAIVCGGTGLYIKSLLYDYNFVEMEKPDDSKYDKYTNEQLYEMLKAIDEKSTETIHPNNRKRVIRALQIAESGKTKSEIEEAQSHKMIYDAKIIGLTMDRDYLKSRIDKRVDMMIEMGLTKEVMDLFNKYDYNNHCFQGIGYKEYIGYFLGNENEKEVIEEIKTHTKQFAKRQFTWFKHQMNIDWYDIQQEDYVQKILSDVEDYLNS